ncbi:PilN domain-containing protein [Halomonas sp. TRM85114]|uniref:PilN domain-containing protein n=1 Tax=Halomonas jincaotanensis TaxID=2810616 RepID=UPI001BD62413|nr:PilN domain-containing protein [Halomonas jincaotanensis]MBS9403158.1 PilN domain-containing protein [Halomonas jincaotanensis]
MTIDINLLPWREEQRGRRSRRFYLTLGLMALLGLGGGYAMSRYYAHQYEAQQQRNAHVRQETRQLDSALLELDELESVREQMLEQVEIFTNLQLGRAQTVHVFSDLVTSLVDGVRYTSLRRQGGNLSLSGLADNNRQVSDQLRGLDAAASLSEPSLSEVEAQEGGERRSFSLSVSQQMPESGSDATEESP